MQTLYKTAFKRLLSKLGVSPVSPLSLELIQSSLKEKNISTQQLDETLYHKLPREEVKNLIRNPCPISNSQQLSTPIVQRAKHLRGSLNITQKRICFKCPFVDKCDKAFVQVNENDKKINHPLENLLLIMNDVAQVDNSKEIIRNRSWFSGVRVCDSLVGVAEDLANGAEEFKTFRTQRNLIKDEAEAEEKEEGKEAAKPSKAQVMSKEKKSRVPLKDVYAQVPKSQSQTQSNAEQTTQAKQSQETFKQLSQGQSNIFKKKRSDQFIKMAQKYINNEKPEKKLRQNDRQNKRGQQIDADQQFEEGSLYDGQKGKGNNRQENFDRRGKHMRNEEGSNRFDRSDRPERSERRDRQDRFDRSSDRFDRSSDRFDRSSDRFDRSSDRFDRSSDRQDKPERPERTQRQQRRNQYMDQSRQNRYKNRQFNNDRNYRGRDNDFQGDDRVKSRNQSRGQFQNRRPYNENRNKYENRQSGERNFRRNEDQESNPRIRRFSKDNRPQSSNGQRRQDKISKFYTPMKDQRSDQDDIMSSFNKYDNRTQGQKTPRDAKFQRSQSNESSNFQESRFNKFSEQQLKEFDKLEKVPKILKTEFASKQDVSDRVSQEQQSQEEAGQRKGRRVKRT